MPKDLVTVDDDIIDDNDLSFMMMTFMMVVFAGVVVPVVQSTQSLLSAQAYQGPVDTRTLHATPTVKYINLIGDPPYSAWIAADFTNKGPGKAYVGVNTPGPWIGMDFNPEAGVGEGGSINMVGAGKRIEMIFYKTDPGETADIEVIGKY